MRSFKAIEVHILSGHYFDKVFYMNTANCKCVCYPFYERYQSQYCKNVVQHHVYPTKIQGTWGRRGWMWRGVLARGQGRVLGGLSLLLRKRRGERGVIGWALTDTNDAAEGGAPLGANCNATPHHTAPLGFTMYSWPRLRVSCNWQVLMMQRNGGTRLDRTDSGNKIPVPNHEIMPQSKISQTIGSIDWWCKRWTHPSGPERVPEFLDEICLSNINKLK